MRTILFKHPILSFVLANLFLVTLIAIIFSLDYVPIQLAPGLFAVLIVATIKRKRGVQRLLETTVFRKVYTKWYLFALFAPIVFCICSYSVFCLIEYGKLAPPLFNNPELYVLDLLIITIGSYGEEIGWRGFLLPKLQKKHSLFISSLVIGLIWGIWHLQFRFGLPVFFIYLFMVVELSFIFSWISSKTDRNILAAIILHTSLNMSTSLLFEHILIPETVNKQFILLMYGSWALCLTLPSILIIKRMLLPQINKS